MPLLSFFFRTAGTVPIAPIKEDPEMLERAYDKIAAYLEEGEIVMHFPEGRITDTGEMYPFKKGIQRIVERTPVPVIPMALQRTLGSFFSRWGGWAMRYPAGFSRESHCPSVVPCCRNRRRRKRCRPALRRCAETGNESPFNRRISPGGENKTRELARCLEHFRPQRRGFGFQCGSSFGSFGVHRQLFVERLSKHIHH